MRKIFFFTVFALAIISCHTSRKLPPTIVIEKDNVPSFNGKWQLKMLFASENAWTMPPFININLKNKTFTGNSSCNSISGKFIIIESYLGFDKNIISTKMACTNPDGYRDEKAFLSALLKINKYTINKDELELSQGEIVLMKFKRDY